MHRSPDQLKQRLLDFLDPARSIPLFIIGTATLTLGLQALYDFANDPATFQGGYWLALIAFILAALLLVYTWRRYRYTGRVSIQEELQPSQRRGLILLAGPSEASAPASIDYHLPVLQHCWIIATAESLKTAARLAERYRGQIKNIYWGAPTYLVDPDQIQETYALVVRILEVEALQVHIDPSALIADITGGTKPMTTGMGLACLAGNLDMEYMKAPRDAEGQVIPGERALPVRIDSTFIPTARFPLK